MTELNIEELRTALELTKLLIKKKQSDDTRNAPDPLECFKEAVACVSKRFSETVYSN